MGHDDERGKEVSNRSQPAEGGPDPVAELSDLHPAFDSIDDTMKDVARKEVTVTSETLAQIVNDAVARAITEYEQARGLTADAARDSQGRGVAPHQARDSTAGRPADAAAAPLSPWRAKIEQLKGDMGFDEIQFDAPPPEPVGTLVQRELSTQMGLNDFAFEDAPGDAAKPDAPTRTEADALAGWVTPSHDAAPPATPDVDEARGPAAARETIGDDADPKYDWVTAELERLEAEERAAAPDPEPERHQALEPAPNQAPEPMPTPAPEVVAPPIAAPPAAAQPEIRESHGGLKGWFRSALGDEPSAVVPVPEPAARVMPAAPPPPEPAVAAPPPVAARAEEQPKPPQDRGAGLKPVTPEDAAKTVFFTFDPIPPVPPRLPREPKKPKG